MTYLTASASYVDRDSKTENTLETKISVFVLPRWIYDAIISKFNLMEAHEYKILRNALSVSDVAQLEVLRNHITEKGFSSSDKKYGLELGSFVNNTGRYLFSGNELTGISTMVKVTPEETIEINGTVNRLAADPQFQEEMLTRLKTLAEIGNGNDSDCLDSASYTAFPTTTNKEKEVPYKVLLIGTSLYIIVEEGFFSHVEKVAEKLAFFTQVLKSAYSIAPVSVVNRSVWYRQYLLALAGR